MEVLYTPDKYISVKMQVTELCLCEQKHLILKPDQLYIFRTDPACKACLELAKEGASP